MPPTPPLLNPSPAAPPRSRTTVPYITAWSGEAAARPRVVVRDGGIGYARERAGDRDAFGVLWRRIDNRPGRGRPEFGRVHHLRQRRAMGALRCQVCGKPAAREAGRDGVLFLLGREEYDFAPWPEPILTAHPPLCARCAALSVSACPHLRDHYVALRARAPRLHGVRGILHLPDGPGTRRHSAVTVAFTEKRRLRWTEAAQLLVRLDSYRLVDLETVTAGRGA